MECLAIIVALSVPFSLLMFAMLREAFSLLPGLTATIAGLAVAAASATVLNLFHPFDAAVVDLLVHALAVALVVVVSRIYGRRLWDLRIFLKPRNLASVRREGDSMGECNTHCPFGGNAMTKSFMIPLSMAMCIALAPAAFAQTMAPQGSSMSKPDKMASRTQWAKPTP